jgi:hypothetical protein
MKAGLAHHVSKIEELPGLLEECEHGRYDILIFSPVIQPAKDLT